MKRIAILLSAVALLFTASYKASAQSVSSAPPSKSGTEQSLQDLVKEVRELRSEVRRLGVATYKGQIVVEHLKLQQAEVVRLSRELSEAHEAIPETSAKLEKLKESIKWMQKEVDDGMKSGKQVSEAKAELEASTQALQRLIERKSQLSGELQEARSKLAEIEIQLRDLEREVVGPQP